MALEIDEATEQFLLTARWDLQRQLGQAGMVERLDLDTMSHRETRLTAHVRVASQTIDFSADGTNMIDAYAALMRSAYQPIMTSALRQLLEPNTD
jgi:hypothetical protein